MPETDPTTEENRLMELETQRHQAQTGNDTQEEKPRKEKPREGTHINIIEGGFVLGFAIVMDLADYFIIGFIPILGDILDLVAGASIWLWVKIRGLDRSRSIFISWSPWIATGIELIPLIGDLPPSYTINVLVVIILNSKWGQAFSKLLKVLSPV